MKVNYILHNWLVNSLACEWQGWRLGRTVNIEHMKHTHPIVVCNLNGIFNVFVFSGHIPRAFEASLTASQVFQSVVLFRRYSN